MRLRVRGGGDRAWDADLCLRHGLLVVDAEYGASAQAVCKYMLASRGCDVYSEIVLGSKTKRALTSHICQPLSLDAETSRAILQALRHFEPRSLTLNDLSPPSLL